MEPSPPEPAAVCANCSAPLAAEYCGHCGQRRFRPADRQLPRLLGQFVEALTDLDSRVWRSLRALLLQPGRLTRDWFGGRRAHWMSPVALFLLANLLYFLMPAITDFDLPLRDHVSAAVLKDFVGPDAARPHGGGQLHSVWTEDWVRSRLDARQAALDASAAAPGRTAPRAFETLEQDYARASSNYSKLLIVLHVPFLALALHAMMLGLRRYYAEHFVAALHYFAFVLFFLELLLLPAAALVGPAGQAGAAWAVRLAGGAVLAGHAVLLLRRGYRCGWPRALLAGVALPLCLVAINVTLYRAVQFAIVFALA